MLNPLRIQNSLTAKKELFEPLNPPFVGMYVCGPTVYSDVHLGNVRTFVSFDVIYRYLRHLGYKVRYVRNITDVGHLTGDVDDGEDKIGRKAKLENIEPMEIVQRYTKDFHRVMDKFNALPPNIEPSATGHILEQIEMVQALLDKGLAYESNESVYFNMEEYRKHHRYGRLSGRRIEELLADTRELEGQEEKNNKVDFALWKKAADGHIMRWSSPWGQGFPGWHLECTVMGAKYLGNSFDIHGGGMDLKFPHHECELAQSLAAHDEEPVKYWIHTNMLTVNGQKMSKSLGNAFLPRELFAGEHELLDRAYSPMTLRFFMLQSHYASTLDFSNDALLAASRGYRKLMNGIRTLRKINYRDEEGTALNQKVKAQINQLCNNCYRAMSDDFNTALTIGHLFNLLKKINSIQTQNLKPAEIGEETFERMKTTYTSLIVEVLGLKEENNIDSEGILDVLINIYSQAKEARDYDKVDEMRTKLKTQGVVLKDTKSGIDWTYEE